MDATKRADDKQTFIWFSLFQHGRVNGNFIGCIDEEKDMVRENDKNKLKILFVATGKLQGFYKRDYEILRKNYEVTYFHFPVFPHGTNKVLMVFGIFKNSIRIFRYIIRHDVSFGWFASLHTFLAVIFSKILNKKIIIVTGGYDVEVMPEIGYGATNFLRKLIGKIVLKYADIVLPFSDYALEKTLQLQSKANTRAVLLACDTEKFKPSGKKEKLVLTVCLINKSNLKRKGLETFVKAAKLMPDTRFVVIGKFMDDAISYLKSISPTNVGYTGFVPDNELVKWYQKAKVYCQLSYQEGEGGGGALGEAMACECIPVVSKDAVALEETVGELGFYVPYGDAKATAEAIKKALDAPDELGKRARKRIINAFSLTKRKEELSKIIEEEI